MHACGGDMNECISLYKLKERDKHMYVYMYRKSLKISFCNLANPTISSLSWFDTSFEIFVLQSIQTYEFLRSKVFKRLCLT